MENQYRLLEWDEIAMGEGPQTFPMPED